MTTAVAERTVLPGGYTDPDGRVHGTAEVVAMTGRDEELLAGAVPVGAGSAALVTELLARCVLRVGEIAPVTADMARALLVADRQFLLLKIREATFGTTVRSGLACPWRDCGRRIDVEFSTSVIPVVQSTDKGPRYTVTLDAMDAVTDDGGRRHREVEFRLPDGGDQEALTQVVLRNEAEALTALLRRCVTRVGDHAPPPGDLVPRLSPGARRAVERSMAEVAPQLDLTMESTCPECRQAYSVPFEIQSFLLDELRVNAELLRREIHYLAFHYHWSEGEIMSMPRDRRRRYVSLLANEIEHPDDQR